MNARFVQINGKWTVVEETRTADQIADERARATEAAVARVHATFHQVKGANAPCDVCKNY